ncbi:MAG TPA: amino acid ABC transporter permease [Actinomycetota bacterium]|nr:amino acid ABC transporter permease [Actinomycetota bacterium]
MTTETVPQEAVRERPERGLAFKVRAQTPLSAFTLALGVASLALLLIGTLALITVYGWAPPARITAALTSRVEAVIVYGAVAMGALASALGWATYRRMATKPSRGAAIAGAVFGAQTLFLGAILLWFRAGDVETFAENFFDFALLSEFLGEFLRGAVNTILLAVSGQAIGMVLGLLVAVFTLSPRAVVRAPARTYINFFRGTPLLWQLSFFYFGIVLALRMDVSAYTAAILVLGLNAGAYSAEIFRAGIQSIERAQFEAARSVGMTYLQALRYVILPQGIRRVIPPLTNEFVILIKDTSLVAFLGLTFAQRELLSVARDIYSQHFDATPYLAAAAGYLVITLPMIRAVTALERRLRSGLTAIGA